MIDAIQIRPQQAEQLLSWNSEQRALIKRTVAPEATDDELALFLHTAGRAGLDPLLRQIHFTKRNGRVVIIADINGLQARAAREADYEGILHGVACQKDELVYDATTGNVVKHSYNAFGDRGPIVGAWATVRRKGLLPFTAIVRFAEYNAPASTTWKQMPHVMIDKVARSTALRMAYPERFSGIYERAEMDQAGNDGEQPVQPVQTITGKRTAEAKAFLAAKKPPLVVDVKPGQTEQEAEVAASMPEEPPPPSDEYAPATSEREPGDDSDGEPQSEDDEIVVPFGGPSTKGKTLGELDARQLKWLAGALEASVDDPAKARFRDKNEAFLAAVERVRVRR